MKSPNFQHYPPTAIPRKKSSALLQLFFLGSAICALAYITINPDIFVPAKIESNIADNDQDGTVLIKASVSGNEELVKKLLATDIDISAVDSEGRTALIGAAYHGNDSICILLMQAGATLYQPDEKKFTALDYAAARGLVKTVKLLLEKDETKDNEHHIEYAMIMQAAFASMPELLPKGNNKLLTINRISVEGKSPLHIAAQLGSVDIADQLLKRGAKINLKLQNGQTALHWAAQNNRTSVITLLLKNKASIDTQDEDGNTPLMLAARSKSKEAVQLLLSKNAAKNLRNKSGETAQTIAMTKKYTEISSILQK